MKKTRLRVLTYNIHKGFTTTRREFVLRRIRDAIREVGANLVFLQEVLGEHVEHGKRVHGWPDLPQFEFLADEIWPHFAYGRNAVYTSGHHGNAILSQYPLSFWENQDISTNQLERRGLLHAVVEIPHKRKPVHAICTHLGLLETERRSQLEKVCDRIGRMVPQDEPLVLAGDFNDWREKISAPLRQRLEVYEAFELLEGAAARSFPSWLPALKLDRVYYRGLKPHQALSLTRSPWSQLSDHVALCVDLDY